MKLRLLMVFGLALTLGSMGFAQGLATDVGKGAKDVGKAAETGTKDAARGVKDAAEDTAHATDKAARATARDTQKAAEKTGHFSKPTAKKRRELATAAASSSDLGHFLALKNQTEEASQEATQNLTASRRRSLRRVAQIAGNCKPLSTRLKADSWRPDPKPSMT